VELAALRGVEVIATAGPLNAGRVGDLGAAHVFDYNDAGWVEQARRASGGNGVDAAVNAARGGELSVLSVVADGGRFATITGAPPVEERGISIANVYVRPDGTQLAQLASLLGEGRLSISVGPVHPLDKAGGALAE